MKLQKVFSEMSYIINTFKLGLPAINSNVYTDLTYFYLISMFLNDFLIHPLEKVAIIQVVYDEMELKYPNHKLIDMSAILLYEIFENSEAYLYNNNEKHNKYLLISKNLPCKITEKIIETCYCGE